jgi:hypothetical protein
MIDTQLLHDVILVLAVLVGVTAALLAVMLVAAPASRPRRAPYGDSGRTPPGGTRREPEPEPELEPDSDGARELVLR